MYAVIKTGGKQYRVAKDDTIRIERLEAEPGATVTLSDVLLVGGEGGVAVGTPLVAGASVRGEVVAQEKGEKVLIFKKRRRHNYRRKRGHRQYETVLKITEIVAP